MDTNLHECTKCGKQYCNKSSMKNHMLRIHGNPSKNYTCEKCSKAFLTQAELNRHHYNHSTEKPFICEYCGNSYRYKGALSVHYRIHSGEKPYKCSFCDKAFMHLSSVIGHRRRHTGEKPFQCTECGKSFYVKRAMTSHMSVHNKEGKFKCNECSKIFKSRSGYKVHLDFHLGIKRHSCKYCGKTFRAWCNMHKHMKRHLDDRPHKCELCEKTFFQNHELKKHMKSHNQSIQKEDKHPFSLNVVCSLMAEPSPDNCNIEPSIFEDTSQNDLSHIDIEDSQVIYDCDIPDTIDKSPDKCQLIEDNYVSQYLYSHPVMQYASQPSSIQNLYASPDPDPNQRSLCLSSISSANYNCVQSFNPFSYSLSNSDEILTKCKLCRNVFDSSLALRSHLLEYHRIEEENVDQLLA